MKVKLEIDGVIVFQHDDPLSTEGKPGQNESQACYDLEQYRLPSIMRKVLKTAKQHEIV